MKIVEEALESITGYLISIKRNTINGWYELEVGIPSKWVFDENSDVRCEVLKEVEVGKIIKISPKNDDVCIDDLIFFVEFIIETNRKILEKEEELNKKLEDMKSKMEDVTKTFLIELEDLRDKSFKKLSEPPVKKSYKESKPKKTDADLNDLKPQINETTVEVISDNNVDVN